MEEIYSNLLENFKLFYIRVTKYIVIHTTTVNKVFQHLFLKKEILNLPIILSYNFLKVSFQHRGIIYGIGTIQLINDVIDYIVVLIIKWFKKLKIFARF